MFTYRFSFVAALLILLIGPASANGVSPENVDGAVTVDAAAAKALFDKEALFVDVRKDEDWDAGRVPGALHLELNKTFNADALGEEVQKDEEVVIYCNGHKCMRSSEASKMAVDWGFSKVYYFRDGFPAWKKAGYPVE